MDAKAWALHVDQVVSPTTPLDGLMMKPAHPTCGLEFRMMVGNPQFGLLPSVEQELPVESCDMPKLLLQNTNE